MSSTDTATVSEWVSLRRAVGAALFITYAVYYGVYYFASFKQNQRPKLFVQIESVGARLYLFGVGCLLSLNYMQASVHQAVFAYFNMVMIFVTIFTVIFQITNQTIAQLATISSYAVLFIWYMGIVADYYNLLAA